jgi:hypothetical protein
MASNDFRYKGVKISCLVVGLAVAQCLPAQTKLNLTGLSDFNHPGANWHIAGDVKANLAEHNKLNISSGNGILVNQPAGDAHQDLFTNFEHGDLDLELDYMMGKGSNSGIYLQGRYEVQLLDSWEVLNPQSSDNGGIYERWDDAKPEGQNGYEGYAPRQNASRAPGVWQHIKISFQAPRFKSGIKITNAKIISIELNGVAIQENVALNGPTRGAVSIDEVPVAALRFQGDHGQVAFRNIIVHNFNKEQPVISDIKYSIYKGKFEQEPDYETIKAINQKSAVVITSNIIELPKNEFLIKYTGILHIKESGEYSFNLDASGGAGLLKINNATVIAFSNKENKGSIDLTAGDMPIELSYSKYHDWIKASLELTVTGPGIREFTITGATNIFREETDPILVNATENIILRSFMDLPVGNRVVHAVNVGSPQKIHYTYDMDNGMMVQVWRGNFLDATPMWDGRGDGSSKPRGAIQYFGKPILNIEKLSNKNAVWTSDTTATGFRTKGYVLDDKDRPTFKYLLYGIMVNDAISVTENNQGIHREITIAHAPDNLYVRLAEASTIEQLEEGMYLVDDKSYYLKIDNAGGAIPIIREQNGRKELVIPIQTKLSYSILF